MKTPAYNCFKQQPRSSHSLAPRMAVRFSEIWLLIGVVFVVHLPVTRCQLCPQDSTFHDLTGSCIGLIKKNQTYGNAKYYCQGNFRGSTTKKDGHLVFIFDQATDEFVKGLLYGHDVDSALIGLNDRAANGVYAWGDHNTIKATYTAWADNPHTPDKYKQAVVTTKDGWLEYYGSYPAYFVCQVSVDFPTPRIVCPLAEVGKQSPSITCTTDTHTSFSGTGVRFMKTSALVASCNANGCWPSLEYGQVVDVSKLPGKSASASWTLQLRDVSMSDVTDWTCSVEFSNSGYWVASQPCSLSVYIKPTDIRCRHQFVRATVRTTCTAARVYPHVYICSWHVTDVNSWLTVFGQTVSNDLVTGEGYYRATCSASFNIVDVGTYNISVTMVSAVPNVKAETVKQTSVYVERPQQPPQLYRAGRVLQSLWVELVEYQTLSLTCNVTGGYPEVYRTIITCDNISPPFESDSSSVTMGVSVTRVLNGRSCTCKALHAARYNQTSSVEIRVAFPATVTSFWIAKTHSSTSINTGDNITFFCDAAGNPTPQLIIQLQNGLFATNSSTGNVTYQKKATCSDTGRYVCLASNMVQGQPHHDSRDLHLQVRLITTPATITFDPITNTTEASKTVRQDFECHLNYMHVFIPVELVPNSQLTLRELNCRLLNNGTHHKISFDYDECGTSQSFFEDYISIDNEVNVHNILNNTAEITFVEDYTIPLKCLVDRSKHVNGAIQVISRESIHENAVQSTDFHMKEFTTKDYDLEITAYPIQLPINREIFFEVALTNSSSNSTGIFVEKCEATPSIHRNGTVRVSLINFGCSVNPAVKVLPVPEIDRFRFSIQAFHFSGPENVDNMVYVHCSASTCGGVMCDNTCPKSSRRRRRSTRGQASATLTSGSHVVG